MLNLLAKYLYNRKQRVILNRCIYSGVPQGSVQGPLLYLVFINGREKDIKSKVKFFSNDTMVFDIVKVPYLTARDLNLDLINIQRRTHQWKMPFNPDPKKQAVVEMLFSNKNTSRQHPPLYFNGSQV